MEERLFDVQEAAGSIPATCTIGVSSNGRALLLHGSDGGSIPITPTTFYFAEKQYENNKRKAGMNPRIAEQTVAEERERFMDALPTGSVCNCCDRFGKRYKRTITASQAKFLIALHKDMTQGSIPTICKCRVGLTDNWIRIPQYMREHHKVGLLTSRDFHWLRIWGLIEPMHGERADGSKKLGIYRITPLGTAFVLGKVSVRKWKYTYNAQSWETEFTDMLYIYEIEDKDFNYRELMDRI